MISLSDPQLKLLMEAARSLEPERRDTFMRRCAAMLELRGRWFADADVAAVAQLALVGLHHPRRAEAR
jgi:hypothetical protein